MKAPATELLILCCFIALAAGSSAEERRPDSQKRFVGTWRLVSTEENLRGGGSRPYTDLGPDAVGYLMYTEDGHMCATLMKPGRPAWHGDIEEATDAEKISAAGGYTSYCGTYHVDENNHVIVHHPEMSLYPNFIGTEQKRPYRFEGNRLIFSDAVPDGDVERWTIVWEKAGRPEDGVSQTGRSNAESEIKQWEDHALEADLQGDASFYEQNLAEDWTDGTSWGSFQTKKMLVSDLKDSRKNSTTKESLSDMQVRFYGDTAIATYKETYDAVIRGERRVRTIITTDTFVRQGGRWVQVAAHSSTAP